MKSKLQRLLDRIMEIVGEMGGAPAAAMVAFLVAAAAHAAPFASIPQNELRLGSNQTTGTKTLTMGQFGRGLRFNSSNDSLDLVSHILHIGGEDAFDQYLYFDIGLGDGTGNPFIYWDDLAQSLKFSNDGLTSKKLGSGGSGGGGGVNYLTGDDNAGFEDGTTSWTASGGAFTIDSSTPLFGLKSALFDASGSGQTLRSAAKAIQLGLSGKSCLAGISYKYASGSDGDYVLEVYDGTNVISQVTQLKVDTTGATQIAVAGFECPASGTVRIEVKSAVSNPPAIELDGMPQNSGLAQLGSNILLGDIGNAELYGTANYPPNGTCTWSITQSTYAADFPADSSCSSMVVTGSVAAPGTKVPQVSLPNAPEGSYFVSLMAAGTNGGVNGSCELIDENGTQLGESVIDITGTTANIDVRGTVTYSSVGTHTIKLRCATSSGAQNVTDLTASYGNFWVYVYRYPSKTQSTIGGLDATGQSWTGYHKVSSGWVASGTTYADFSAGTGVTLTTRESSNLSVATASGSLPGITFTPGAVARKYWVCAAGRILHATANNSTGLRLVDDSVASHVLNASYDQTANSGYRSSFNLCGMLTSASTSPITAKLQAAVGSGGDATLETTIFDSSETTIEWSVIDISNAFPMVALTKQMQSPSAATMIHASAYVACSSGTCSVTRQDGTWITVDATPSPAAGEYTVHFSTFSSTPNCGCTVQNANGTQRYCGVAFTRVVPTNAILGVSTTDTGGTPSNEDFVIQCDGPK
jgi:hypothetical protein